VKAQITGGIKNYVLRFAGILGLSLNPVEIDENEAAGIEELVAKREEARMKKDWALSDKIRKELSAMNVVVEDTPKGPVWRKN
jgi:cysteinyl-tRNA synthetase